MDQLALDCNLAIPQRPVFSRQPKVIKRTGMTQLTQKYEGLIYRSTPKLGPFLHECLSRLKHVCTFGDFLVGPFFFLIIVKYLFIQIIWVDTHNISCIIIILQFILDWRSLAFRLCFFLWIRLLFRFALFSFDTLIKSNVDQLDDL